MSVDPASQNGFTASTIASRSRPHGFDSARSSFWTNEKAAAKPAVVCWSALTAQPPPNHRNCFLGPIDGRLGAGAVPADRDLPDRPGPAAGSGVAHRPRSRCRPGRGPARYRGDGRPAEPAPCGRRRRRRAGPRRRQAPDAGGADVEVVAAEGDQVAGVQPADDLHRLSQHLLLSRESGPAFADDVLVGFSPAPTPRADRPSANSCTVAAFCATTARWYALSGRSRRSSARPAGCCRSAEQRSVCPSPVLSVAGVRVPQASPRGGPPSP